MKRWAICSGLAAVLGITASMPFAAAAETLISGQEAAAVVVPSDITARDGTVSGVLLNQSGRLVRDVQLLIRHEWLWNDERHPGDDSPGRTENYTVRDQIPPGGSIRFTYREPAPLPQRSDGRFKTSAEVVGFTQIGE
jgi:hypothetical protein